MSFRHEVLERVATAFPCTGYAHMHKQPLSQHEKNTNNLYRNLAQLLAVVYLMKSRTLVSHDAKSFQWNEIGHGI